MPVGDEGRFEHFMTEQFLPFLDRFDQHLEADNRRFDKMTDVVNRISTSLEVQTSVGTALAKKADSIFNRRNAVIALCFMLLSPAAAIAVAVWK